MPCKTRVSTETLIKIYKDGATLRELGAYFGISMQGIYDRMKRRDPTVFRRPYRMPPRRQGPRAGRKDFFGVER